MLKKTPGNLSNIPNSSSIHCSFIVALAHMSLHFFFPTTMAVSLRDLLLNTILHVTLHVSSCYLLYYFSTPECVKSPYFLQTKPSSFTWHFQISTVWPITYLSSHFSSNQAHLLIVCPSVMSHEIPPLCPRSCCSSCMEQFPLFSCTD